MDTNNYPPLIQRLREAVSQQGRTHADLAAACAVDRSWISQVLTARRDGSTALLCRLAQVTGLTADEVDQLGRADVAGLMRHGTPMGGESLRAVPDRELLQELARRLKKGGDR